MQAPSDAVIRYKIRSKCIKILGFKSYKDYLKSDLWKEIKSRVFERDSYKCLRCGKQAVQAHHESYSMLVLKGKDISKIVSICKLCHFKEEKSISDKQKRRRRL